MIIMIITINVTKNIDKEITHKKELYVPKKEMLLSNFLRSVKKK